jgi:endoglucanase
MNSRTFSLLYLFLAPLMLLAQVGKERIQLNQLGFYPTAPKVAIITGSTAANNFYVINADGRDTVFSGLLPSERRSQFSSTLTKTADFSKFQRKGNYTLFVPGIGNSHIFSIDENVYDDVSRAVLKAFYFQRSDIALEHAHAGKWHRPAGHPDTVVLVHPSAAGGVREAGMRISSPGGWYDAGDYNKYIVNSGITMGTMLSAYEDFPDHFNKLNAGIPESAGTLPDLLDEVLCNLRWMLTMQDPQDGGVYHKLTNAAFDGMVMPGVTKAPRYVVQKSTAAALDFAAVTAQAARVYKKFNKQLPGLHDSCLRAAQYAWEWAMKNPTVLYEQRKINAQHTPAVSTGEYGDRNLQDEWLWAAAELYASTKDQQYLAIVETRKRDAVSVPSWANVAMLGYYTLSRHEKDLPAIKALTAAMKDSITRMADAHILKQQSNAFGTVMGQGRGDFIWGSNAVAANQGILLMNAYLITRDKKYIHAAGSNLDYLLGRNATGYCFVTGLGAKSPMHPHHRPSEADQVAEPVPGLLVGGPNPGMQDKCTYTTTEPENAYADVACSYASNEIAINWNAPAVYFFNAMVAVLKGR